MSLVRRKFLALALLAACGSLTPATAHQSDVEPPAAQAEFPPLPPIKLPVAAPPDGADSDRTDWAKEIATTLEKAASAKEPRNAARLNLAAANIVMARMLQPACSAAANSPSPTVGDAAGVDPFLDQAEQLIDDAHASLKKLMQDQQQANGGEANQNQEQAAETAELVQAAETLRAFLDGQKAFLKGETEQNSRRKAASALARLLEHPSRQVAAGARYWQALLRSQESDPSPAIQILPLATTPAHADTWPFGLYSRVMRCRLQGQKGEWSSALLMLVQMEDRLEELATELAHRGDARRLFAYTRLQVLKLWHDSLAPPQLDERTWCARQAHETLDNYFRVEQTVLALDPAIPLIVPVDLDPMQEP